MQILFLAATDFELDTARRAWDGAPACFCVGGWGSEATRQALEPLLARVPAFDRVVDVGIAGSYVPQLRIGTAVHVTAEQYGERPGVLLHNPAPWQELAFLPEATGNTLQELDGRWRHVTADVETMEGAAFFEACLAADIPFAQVRAISNYVGETDHARWDIPLALKNLESALRTLKTKLP